MAAALPTKPLCALSFSLSLSLLWAFLDSRRSMHTLSIRLGAPCPCQSSAQARMWTGIEERERGRDAGAHTASGVYVCVRAGWCSGTGQFCMIVLAERERTCMRAGVRGTGLCAVHGYPRRGELSDETSGGESPVSGAGPRYLPSRPVRYNLFALFGPACYALNMPL